MKPALTEDSQPSGLGWDQRRLTWVRHWDWQTIGLVLGIKVLLLTFGVQAVAAMNQSHPGWLEIWNQWDTTHYLWLAEFGYSATEESQASLVFFPLYPWLVRLAAALTRNYMAAALVVSGLASVATGLLLRRLVLCDESDKVARNAVWFLLIFPTSFFLHVAYTESLFLALTLGCILAARNDRWAIAGMLGAAASLTRINGLVLGPTLAVEVFLQWQKTRRWDWRWLWLGLIPVGVLGYLWLNKEVTGDYFAFMQVMSEHYYKRLASPWFGIHDVWLRALGSNINEGLNELIAVILISVCTIWSWVRLRPSYSVWMTLNWLLITSTAFVISVPRYALSLFPVFILFAIALTGRRFWHAMATVWSILYLALYTGRFVQNLWAF